jgi:hypothetical protein
MIPVLPIEGQRISDRDCGRFLLIICKFSHISRRHRELLVDGVNGIVAFESKWMPIKGRWAGACDRRLTARVEHLQNLLSVSLRAQTVLNERGPIPAQYLGLVSLMGALKYLDLFGTPLFGGHAILRSDLVRVDQFLGKTGLQGNRCENRHCKQTPDRCHETLRATIRQRFTSPTSARHL